MGLFDSAKQAVTDAAIAPVLRERLNTLIDRAQSLETENDRLREEKALLTVKLSIAEGHHQAATSELEQLRTLHTEEVRTHSSVEFRRGVRTSGLWMPFCPVCHAPARANGSYAFICSNGTCNWPGDIGAGDVHGAIAALG